MKHTITVRHPSYVMMSSDYSQQEPKLTAALANEPTMVKTFQEGRDIYATIASIAYNVPYEQCLEFHPETHEYQPDGKKRRGVAKVLVLGINYGMSVQSIGEDLFGSNKEMTDEEKTKEAQKIFDAVMNGFPKLRDAIAAAQYKAKKVGYTETITGRRRHHPNMQLPPFEFAPMKGYVNPDVDPLDPSTLQNKDQIPERIVKQLAKEFSSYKHYGKIVKRTKELAAENIKVINNNSKITEASRQVWNACVQGSAADLTKMAMLRLTNSSAWHKIGGRFLDPIHDELLCEVPAEFAKEGADVLKDSMEGAGSFLPFPIKCDIEQTFRWYGLSVEDVLSFEKPESLDASTMSESNIKWIQCMLNETEYILPTYPDKNGDKPIGIAARGVNGIWSESLDNFIDDYCARNKISRDQYINHVHDRVIYGI